MKQKSNKQQKSNKESLKLSRRQFLGVAAGVGLAATVSGCDVVDVPDDSGWLPPQYHNGNNVPAQVRGRVPIDPKNPSIIRDDKACILCGQCLDVCQNVETVYNYYELPIVDEFICVHCGQCALHCPSGAIKERSYIDQVKDAINDPAKIVVATTSPGVRVSLGEEFGLPQGQWVQEQMVSALRELGFDYVMNIDFSSDSTIMEEGSELVHRLTHGGVLPQFTSCCPGWVKFVEYNYPDLLPNISTAKSPVAEMGAMVKTYWAMKKKIDPADIVVVNIPPCTAKKFEMSRPEMNAAKRFWQEKKGKDYGDMMDVDFVLSTRELATMIRNDGIDFVHLPDGSFDPIVSEGSGAAVIFANNGGVMEAALRSAYFLVTGSEPPEGFFRLAAVRDHDFDGYAEASVSIPGFGTVNVAVCNGLHAARTLCEEIRAGKRKDLHFLEVMTCPGGCIGGGGQAKTVVPPTDALRACRIDSLYEADANMAKENRVSHKNKEIAALYKDFLGEPLSEMAELILHTHYTDRSKSIRPKDTSDYVDPTLGLIAGEGVEQ
ncbi:MAG: iron hydrogenase small subunit [Firmicutes bacterium]|nr:iron hydrogenase small subunit [Bacillota bacterium]